MRTPIAQLIEEIKVEMRQSESILKRSGISEHQKHMYHTQRTTLFNVLYNLENNYLNIELNFINKLKK